MKQRFHRLWIVGLAALPWVGVSAGPALAAVQSDLAREADRSQAAQSAQRAAHADQASSPSQDPASPVDVATPQDHPHESESTSDGRYFCAPSAIKPGDSESGSGFNAATVESCRIFDTLLQLEQHSYDAGAICPAGLHHPIYQAQAPPQR